MYMHASYHTYTHVHPPYKCTYAYILSYIHAMHMTISYMRVHMHTFIMYIHSMIHQHTHIHLHTHTYTCTYTHAHTHTHTHTHLECLRPAIPLALAPIIRHKQILCRRRARLHPHPPPPTPLPPPCHALLHSLLLLELVLVHPQGWTQLAAGLLCLCVCGCVHTHA